MDRATAARASLVMPQATMAREYARPSAHHEVGMSRATSTRSSRALRRAAPHRQFVVLGMVTVAPFAWRSWWPQ